MKYLLDTVTFLRAYFGETDLLTKGVFRILEDQKNTLFLSAASVWEISIKYSLGRLNIKTSPDLVIQEGISKMLMTPLLISFEHVLETGRLPWHHRDPFDRLLIAQSRIEEMTVITPDSLFKKYGVKVLW